MAARTLDQILSELNTVYDPQIASIRQRQSMLPGQIEAEEKGLAAKQEQAYGDILSGARRRGLGFSGIPLGEQAKYNATEYMPALARLRQSGREQALSLEDAILGLNERRRTQAQSIFESERNFFEQQRQFNEQMAAQERARQDAIEQARAAARASSSGGSWLNALGGGKVQGASVTPQTLRQKWQMEASKGDWNAQVALNYAGDDGRFDGPVNSPEEYNILRKLGIKGNYYVRGTVPASRGVSF